MSHTGAATYKKTLGIININEDIHPAELHWRSTDGDKSVTIILNAIDKLQATPASSEKMMLRLMSKPLESQSDTNTTDSVSVTDEHVDKKPKPSPAQTYMFSFNNRLVMDNIKITLQHIISRYKDDDIYEAKKKREEEEAEDPNNLANKSNTSSFATTPIGNNTLINTSKLDDSLSKNNLLSNFKLQQSLLKENKQLMKVFQDTVIHAGLNPDEFWSIRISQLRAFALTTSQKIGPYNVLSTIKPVASSDNKVNVNISREKIHSIFSNYPIVKKAYIDNVPKNFKEPEFWARFFSSKLFRKLRGEKIMQNDRGDVIIDRYLKLDQEFDRKDDEKLLHPVKKFIDLDGNIEDDPVLKGNKKDFTMQPGTDVNGNSDGTIDILKGMNRLSEKMILSLENEYSRTNNNVDDVEEDEAEIKFNDLQTDLKPDYAIVHFNLTNKQKSNSKNDEVNNTSVNNIKIPITEGEIKDQIKIVDDTLIKEMDLTQVEDKEHSTDINKEINKRVLNFVKINAKQAKNNNLDSALGSFVTNSNGKRTSDHDKDDVKTDIPLDLLDSCRMLHITCCEFLKHFYNHFQSGDPKQASTVKNLYTHLKNCSKKINELLADVKNGDGEDVSKSCQNYLSTTLKSIDLAIEKYDTVLSNFQKRVAQKV